MTNSPKNFADRPNPDVSVGEAAGGNSARSRDILSFMLRGVRLRGEEVYCCAPAEPFAISFGQSGGTIHIVSQGDFELEVEGEATTYPVGRGDVVLVGSPHVIRRGRRVQPRPLEGSDQRHEVVTDGHETRWLSGTFSSDYGRKAYLLEHRPPIVQLRGVGDQSLLWLDVSTQMLMKEMTEPTQGSREMISRILDLLYIQVVRAWATGPDATPGWLTGAMDPVIGEVIAAIHAEPVDRWSIDRLAQTCNMSRSAFSERFSRLMGQPPAAYVTLVRLANAADLLLDTEEAVNEIAVRSGYRSEAAFSRAFSQRYGMPPSRWRSQMAGP